MQAAQETLTSSQLPPSCRSREGPPDREKQQAACPISAPETGREEDKNGRSRSLARSPLLSSSFSHTASSNTLFREVFRQPSSPLVLENIPLLGSFIFFNFTFHVKAQPQRERLNSWHGLSISPTASREVDNLSGLTTPPPLLEALPARRRCRSRLQAWWARTLAEAA